MQSYHRRAIISFTGCLLLWLMSAQSFEKQANAQAAVPPITIMQKVTPTPYVPPAEQGGSINLVCGAAILVIIIVGGVVWSQWFSGQADKSENQDTDENPSGQPAP